MMMDSPPSTESIAAADVAFPLGEFYARHGHVLPPLQQIDGGDVPEPYRGLLVHESDMTSTLEEFHGGAVRIEVLGKNRRHDEYTREVILRTEATGQPIEFGAIKIFLDRFPEEARRQILAEHWPLGRILKEADMPFLSRPKAYLRIASDPLINRVLGLNGAQVLFGRRNTLTNADGEVLAEIVEILPPVKTKT